MKKIYLCQTDDLEQYQAKGFSADTGDESLDLLLLKQDGQVRAYLNYCPHLGIPLNWQPDAFMSMEGTHIQCSTHGALFQIEDGFCFTGPCRGQSLTPLNIEITDESEIYLIAADAENKQSETA